MSEPRRVQLSRKRGWKMPKNSVRVCRPSKWGNPYTIQAARIFHPTESESVLRERVVRAYAEYLTDEMRVAARRELAGKNLACFCPLDQPCHADVLLKLANKIRESK